MIDYLAIRDHVVAAALLTRFGRPKRALERLLQSTCLLERARIELQRRTIEDLERQAKEHAPCAS